ncbi:sterile alpha motif domain-containing protein 9-like [Boleophthalmus pectinirostris]|uniref:sterile alpha motif domain-containing protein 9-like n=1 Tax=Boleophthalmus pectinirostris TaxID=150288 RepID=UPI0024303CA2|nr:sterile alpha motif domain-containing protein 9-like [Boleophthalmus pectinirostris]
MAEMQKNDLDLSTDMEHWSKDQVREWALRLEGVDDTAANTLFEQDITGPSLMLLKAEDLTNISVKLGPAKVLLHSRDETVKLKKEQPEICPGRPCKPYPFYRCHDTYRYMEGSILDVTESGASDFYEPCHEYKAFTNTTEETKMIKFTSEVIRFAAACMNSRTNGTIHFGIGDVPEFTHGQVLGVVVEKDREVYDKTLRHAISQCFELKHVKTAQTCIKPPRFVSVLNTNLTSSEKFVIEVDIVPDSSLCEKNIYHTVNCSIKKKKNNAKASEGEQKQFFVREGGSSRNLLAPTTNAKPMHEFNNFVASVPQLLELRRQAEEKHLNKVKNHVHGSKLCQMITGGTGSLDKSFYEHYIIVTNKSHPIQLDSIGFLVELNPVAVLDFDPQSCQNGLCEGFEKKSPVNLHSPDRYKITESVEDIAKKLQLTRSTSWVFCNGKTGEEQPSEINLWLMDKGASVRNVISFLCRKDVLRNKRFLVVFVLLSRVNDKMDPLVETFCTFYQELKGTEQILCICENENAFTSWKNLIDARCEVDISNRCIYELSFAEVNGTILSLLSENRRSSRFLPGAGGSRVCLEKKVERQLTTLDVLCVNQCEGGNEDQVSIEQNFYRGGEVSWWNFYFSEQPGSMPFIKRDKFVYITDTLIPDLCSLRKACVLLNLLHVPGCGGTTLAKHTLWTFRGKFRCAVLIDNDADPVTVAEHVFTLLQYGCKEQELPVPVLLMIDDFEDMEKVFNLQQLIEKQCLSSSVQSRSPQVILLNCMRCEHIFGPTDPTEDTVFIGNKLTDDDQKQFDQKLAEMEKTHDDTKTFYGFMVMKSNFNTEYIRSVVHHTLQSFNMEQKHAQLLAVLALSSVYCKHAALSVSLCEEYLMLPKPYFGDSEVEEGFKQFSTLILSCDIRSKVLFKGVRMIHSQIALHCLKEMNLTHKVSKAEIANFILTTDELYDCTQGKNKLMQDIHNILVKRYPFGQEAPSQPSVLASASRHKPTSCTEQEDKMKEEKVESRFSPLIRDIESETPGLEEDVLINASSRFQKDAIIAQLLARYYYLKKKDFNEAKSWARRSKHFSQKNSSYISDTSAQVIKHELKYSIANENFAIDPEALQKLLKLAKSAMGAFKETQQLAKHESFQRLQSKRDYSPLNTSGFLGEIQVCVHIIEVLEKIPLFSSGKVRHDLLCSMLSGRTKLDQMKDHDPEYKNHVQFYKVLEEFAEMLYSLKNMMKSNFDFLVKFNVNLASKFGMRESCDQIAKSELSRCFGKFAQLFCLTESEPLLNKSMNTILKLHKARQFIEKEELDTYSGILNCLSNDNKQEILGDIVSAYKFIYNSDNCSPVEKMNYIYMNVVLSCINLKLIEEPFPRLVNILCKCLKDPLPKANLPLYFIAVLLLWPQQQRHLNWPESADLRSYISHMKTAFHTEMKHIYNGKRPIVHFFLGKKAGYERIVHLGEVKRCSKAEKDQFASKWENGVIWKNPKVQELLCRVTGKVRSRTILVRTVIPDVNIEVTPQFQSQLRGYREGSTVSFFIGFSMQGPLAIDIDNIKLD